MRKNLPDHPHMIDAFIQAYLQDANSKAFEGVVVYDGVCGIGKTTDIFDHINDNVIAKNPKNKVIFVGVYLAELHRVAGTKPMPDKKSQPPIRGEDKKVIYADSRLFKRDFTHLENKPTKTKHFEILLRQGKDIVITHSIFNNINKECLDIIKKDNYHIIIDEEPSTIQFPEEYYTHSFKNSSKKYKLTQKEINELLQIGAINYSNEEVTWGQYDLDRYRDFRADVDANRIVVYNHKSENGIDKIFLWRQNPEAFKSFKTVHILTYLFKDSYLQAYFDICKMPYLIKNRTVEEALDSKKLRAYHTLINVHSLKDFDIPLIKKDQLTSGWYDEFKLCYKVKDDNDLRKKLTSFFKSIMPAEQRIADSDEKMWTTYKKAKSRVQGKGYTKGFVAFNARATNEYRNRKQLAYTVNVYSNPVLINYCRSYGCSVNQDSYATSVLIQWLFRSALREGEPVHLLLPSKRMQILLNAWIVEIKDLYEFTRLIANNDMSEIKQRGISSTRSVKQSKLTTNNYINKQQPGLKHLPVFDELLNLYPKV